MPTTMPAMAPPFIELLYTGETEGKTVTVADEGIDVDETCAPNTGGMVTAAVVPQQSLFSPQHQVVLFGGAGSHDDVPSYI